MNRSLKLMLLIFAVLLTMACSVEELYLNTLVQANDETLQTPAGTDDTPVIFTIEQGQSVAQIAGNLKAMGLISDTDLFKRYLQSEQLDAGIQAGTYTLRQTMTIPQIAKTLHAGDVTEQIVTIPEGKRLEEVAALVGEQADIDPNVLLQLAQTGWSTTGLVENYEVLSQVPVTATLEGYLFPDTYRLAPDATPYDVIAKMLENFEAQVTPEIRAKFSEHGLTLHEGLTMASIVEREAVLASEQALIAGVYYNRLAADWLLNADPTVQYALGYQPEAGTWWKGGLTFDDLDIDSPYNTYRVRGLPPGPIGNPGLSAIAAAAEPEATEYFYFMADCIQGDGSHVFAVTEEEHLANFNRCNEAAP